MKQVKETLVKWEEPQLLSLTVGMILLYMNLGYREKRIVADQLSDVGVIKLSRILDLTVWVSDCDLK